MPPRLRTSCDVCHSAKIKCVTTDTGCQRCDSFTEGLPCKFSPVLPRIYRSHRKRVEDAQTSRANPPTESSLLDDLYGPDNNTQAVPSQIIYPPAPVLASTLDQQDYGIGANAEENFFLWPYAPPSLMEKPQDLSVWLNNIEAASPSTSAPALTNGATPTDAVSSTSLLPHAHRSGATTGQNASHCPSATSSLERTCAGTPCDCFSRLLEAMRSMNTCTITYNPKLDVVLCTNRTAAKICLASLQCSHALGNFAHDTADSCLTIACGLLDRILVSYQAALENFCTDSDGEREKEGKEHGHDNDERMTAQTTTVELRFGSFTLERSEQILWAREVVAREAGSILRTLKGLEVRSRGIWTVLLPHLLERYETVIDQVSRS